MKSNIITIIKKELARFFKDGRMVFTTVLMPGILIYFMYSFMGNGLSEMYSVDDDYTYQMSVVNMPSLFAGLEEMENMEVEPLDETKLEAAKKAISDKKIDAIVVFPEDFDQQVAQMEAGKQAPNISIYYDSSITESLEAYQIIYAVCDETESLLANKFDVCAGTQDYDLASEEDSNAVFLGMLLPMLIMTFLFSGSLSVAAESIAGEKERGTIATLLVTPMKRGELAIGKIVSLSVIGLLSGCSSFIGTMLSIPNLIGDTENEFKVSYEMVDYVWLFLVILSTTIVIVGLISLISALSKSVKQATTATTPLMLVVVVLGLSSMMGGGVPSDLTSYMIPLYNSVQCMTGIFTMDYSLINVAVTIGANLICSLVLVFGLSKIFDSERIMYT